MSDVPETVQDYLAAQPEAVRERLAEVRRCILAVAPDAEESIRYGMPAYRLASGRPVFWAAWKQHTSLHAVPRFDAELEAEVAPLRHGKDTVRFAHRRPLPVELLSRIITAIAAQP